MGRLDASIVVCTHNRAHLVSEVLDALLAQELPDEISWEIVVVDNNSDDRTSEVLGTYERMHPHRIRHLFEGQQGKSCALNRALRNTDSEFLLFTDDDVKVEPVWAAEIIGFLRDRPEIMGIGGRVLPRIAANAEPTLSEDEIARYFSYDFGEEPVRVYQNPFGANMAYRRSAFEQHGAFRLDLGPTGDNRAGLGEDSEFGERVLGAGQEIWYLPRAAVHHPVQDYQLTPGHLDRWHFEYGRALLRRTGLPDNTSWVFSVPRFLLRSLIEAWLAWVFSFTQRQRRRRRWQLQKVRGQIYEAHRIHRSGEPLEASNDEGLGHRT